MGMWGHCGRHGAVRGGLCWWGVVLTISCLEEALLRLFFTMLFSCIFVCLFYIIAENCSEIPGVGKEFNVFCKLFII